MLRVHPAADIFPMQPDDGLQSLAESIKAHGLRFPIVVRQTEGVIEEEFFDGMLVGYEDIGSRLNQFEMIDGRNRWRACELAGVKPTFTIFEGNDVAVLAFVADANLQRRDLKKTQKAAVYAKLYPDNAKRGPKSVNEIDKLNVNSIDDELINSDNFYKQQLSKCRIVGRYSAALLDDVIADRVPLETAFKEAHAGLARSNSAEAVKERLRDIAPDIADKVEDGTLSLAAAIVENDERIKRRKEDLDAAREASETLWHEISARLGTIARGKHLGVPYVLPAEDREMAALVMAELTQLSGWRPE